MKNENSSKPQTQKKQRHRLQLLKKQHPITSATRKSQATTPQIVADSRNSVSRRSGGLQPSILNSRQVPQRASLSNPSGNIHIQRDQPLRQLTSSGINRVCNKLSQLRRTEFPSPPAPRANFFRGVRGPIPGTAL